MLIPMGGKHISGAASVMASDASALYWYAPDSVVRSGATITGWDDKTANGIDLSQVSTAPLPTYNTGGDYVEFDGTQIIGASGLTASQENLTDILFGGGSVAIFAVAHADTSTMSNNSERDNVIVSEGNSTSNFSNNNTGLSLPTNTFLASPRGRVAIASREHSFAVYIETSSSPSFANADVLVEVVVTQSTADVDINNGALTETDSVTPDKFPSKTSPQETLFVGARWSGSSVEEGFFGRIYEIFATSNTDSSHVAAVQAELAAKYGL